MPLYPARSLNDYPNASEATPLGTVTVIRFLGKPTLWEVTGTLGAIENKLAYDAACARASAKLPA